MDDFISRQSAIDALGERPMVWTEDNEYDLGCASQYDSDRLAIETVPSADVQPVRHGHWIIPRFGADAKCSVCGYYFNDAYDMENEDNYCRHCGALMDGDRNDIR